MGIITLAFFLLFWGGGGVLFIYIGIFVVVAVFFSAKMMTAVDYLSHKKNQLDTNK